MFPFFRFLASSCSIALCGFTGELLYVHDVHLVEQAILAVDAVASMFTLLAFLVSGVITCYTFHNSMSLCDVPKGARRFWQ